METPQPFAAIMNHRFIILMSTICVEVNLPVHWQCRLESKWTSNQPQKEASLDTPEFPWQLSCFKHVSDNCSRQGKFCWHFHKQIIITHAIIKLASTIVISKWHVLPTGHKFSERHILGGVFHYSVTASIICNLYASANINCDLPSHQIKSELNQFGAKQYMF